MNKKHQQGLFKNLFIEDSNKIIIGGGAEIVEPKESLEKVTKPQPITPNSKSLGIALTPTSHINHFHGSVSITYNLHHHIPEKNWESEHSIAIESKPIVTTAPKRIETMPARNITPVPVYISQEQIITLTRLAEQFLRANQGKTGHLTVAILLNALAQTMKVSEFNLILASDYDHALQHFTQWTTEPYPKTDRPLLDHTTRIRMIDFILEACDNFNCHQYRFSYMQAHFEQKSMYFLSDKNLTELYQKISTRTGHNGTDINAKNM